MKIKKGDTVKVLYGKDAGKTAKVLHVFLKSERLIVDGLNTFKKHIKGDGQKKKSEIAVVVRPMPIAKVQLVCSLCGKPTRVAMKRENGKVVRVCKKCGKTIDVIKEKVEKSKVKKEEIKTEKTDKKTIKTTKESK